MRIIAGQLKGTTIHMPKKGITRPLKDMVRESIFNLLNHSKNISLNLENSKILDLYAGSGSFGLECLSRGAENVFFVENELDTINILKKNIEKLKVEKKTKIFINDIFKIIESRSFYGHKFKVIFCDPPYKNDNINKLIQLIFDEDLLEKNGIIILHRNKSTKDKMSNFFEVLEERIYGLSKIIFGKFSS
tara:strand:- start:2754 stop:3323 length:570 start_codon:yes stop_codon:yes gene_type:complete